MSGTVNKVFLLGRLGRDPERFEKDGRVWATFSMATEMTWKDAAGARQKRTEWHNVVVFAQGIAEKIVLPYLKKGSSVFVEGRIETREWADKTGARRWTTEVVVRNFGGSVTLVESGGERAPVNEPDDTGGGAAAGAGAGAIDDDIPF